MSTFTVALAALVALRLPIAQMRLPDQSRSLSLAGVIGQFPKLASATGLKVVTVVLVIELVVLLLVSLVIGVLASPNRSDGRRHRLLDLSIGLTGVVVALLALSLIPILEAADHVDAAYGVAPFHVDGGGAVTLLVVAVLAISTTWHNRQVHS